MTGDQHRVNALTNPAWECVSIMTSGGLPKQKLSVSSDLISAELQREALSGCGGAAQSQACFGQERENILELCSDSVKLVRTRYECIGFLHFCYSWAFQDSWHSVSLPLSRSHHSNLLYFSETGNYAIFSPFNVTCITSREGCVDGHPVRLFGVQISHKGILGLNYSMERDRAGPQATLPLLYLACEN